jgi:hypothetical protein
MEETSDEDLENQIETKTIGTNKLIVSEKTLVHLIT